MKAFFSYRKNILITADSGFTLIELLYSVVIVGILASVMWGFFSFYKDDAAYSTSEITLKNARVALEVGDAEAPLGVSLPFTYSGTSGGILPAVMSDIMPGATTPEGARIGVLYNKCDSSSDPLDVNEFIVSQSCASSKHLRFTKFCGGIEVMVPEVPQTKGCPDV